jgi:hypothetical protein
MYPLLVACKSQSQARQAAAYAVLDIIRTHSATLVEQAQLVRPWEGGLGRLGATPGGHC